MLLNLDKRLIMQKNILLVDDDEEEFYIMKMALEMAELNCKCVWANGLEQATQIIKELQPEFVFIDINMPRYDGLNCLKKLKVLEPLRHSVFVIYSTYISEDNCTKALQLGATCCMRKSENINALLVQLVVLFNNKTHCS